MSGKRTEKPILNFVIDTDLLNMVDEYRYENKIPTRAEAVRQLLQMSLEQWKKSKH